MEIKGFSLLELLLALSLAALIAAAAIPAWQQLLDRSRATAEINRLIATIQYARSQAVHRRQTVTLCPADGQLGCGGDWARGIIVFADGNSDGTLGRFLTDDMAAELIDDLRGREGLKGIDGWY